MKKNQFLITDKNQTYPNNDPKNPWADLSFLSASATNSMPFCSLSAILFNKKFFSWMINFLNIYELNKWNITILFIKNSYQLLEIFHMIKTILLVINYFTHLSQQQQRDTTAGFRFSAPFSSSWILRITSLLHHFLEQFCLSTEDFGFKRSIEGEVRCITVGQQFNSNSTG